MDARIPVVVGGGLGPLPVEAQLVDDSFRWMRRVNLRTRDPGLASRESRQQNMAILKFVVRARALRG